MKQGKDMGYPKYFLSHSEGEDVPFLLATLPASRRMEKRDDFFLDVEPCAGRKKIHLARNEYEGFQAILLGSPKTGAGGIKVEISEFIHENGRDRLRREWIEWGRIDSITTEAPDIPVPFTGNIPDPIIEDGKPVSVAAGDFTPVYFRFYAGNEAAPGIYRGEVSFRQGNFEKRLEVKARVFDFELPARNSIRMVFSFFDEFYKNWYGYETLTEEQQFGIYDFLLKYRITPNNIYSGENTCPPLGHMKRLSVKGANFLTVNARVPDAEKVVQGVKSAGLWDDCFFYSYDEVDFSPKRAGQAREELPEIMECFPDLKTVQTSFPHPDIEDLFNVWCPKINYFINPEHMEKLEDMRGKGRAKEIWWYTADDPAHPFPNFFLDYPVFDLRIIMTLGYMYNVDGILYWCINREWAENNVEGSKWPEIPWKPYIHAVVTGTRKYKNGMGNLVYPGPGGRIYASLRLENLRDGVEDYEYLKLLEQKVMELKLAGGNPRLEEEAEALLEIPEDVALAVNNYSPDPEHLMDYRLDIAGLIERINTLLK